MTVFLVCFMVITKNGLASVNMSSCGMRSVHIWCLPPNKNHGSGELQSMLWIVGPYEGWA